MTTVSANHDDLDSWPTTFALRLRDFRLRAGLSQQQLADFSTLSVRTIRDIENGRVAMPRQGTCDLLMSALNDGTPRPVFVSSRHTENTLLDHGLPRSASAAGPFVGRDDELAALANICDSEHFRLVTVTGIEGVGKTRLCAEFARRLRSTADVTVLWLTAGAMARELAAAGRAERLAEAIRDRRSLIVFDGEWPVDVLAGVVEQLLDECPRLTAMVTARRPTGLPMESLLPLGSLSTAPDGSAVGMLLMHVELLQPSFRLTPQNAAAVAEICEAVDGIPAALEGAARWSLLYSPQELARLLRDDPLLVSTPPGPGARGLFSSVRQTVIGLSARQRRLLTSWYENAAAWTVAEAASVAGLGDAECADDVFTLMTLGLLRRHEDGDRVTFEALRILRSLRLDIHG